MSSRILKETGEEISRTSVYPLSIEDRNSDIVKAQIHKFEQQLKDRLGDRMTGIALVDDDDDLVPSYDAYVDDENPEDLRMPEADEYDHDAYHKFISARIQVPSAGELKTGTVTRRKRDDDGHLIGRANPNPILDTSVYEVLFDDGHIETFAANTIAENIYAQVDDEGNVYSLIDEIIDHRKTNAALHADDAYVEYKGRRRLCRTTKGWQLCVQLKDGTTSWERLADLKESNPVQAAEYAVNNKLVHEPAFQWWVPYTIRKRDRIISKLRTRYLRKEQKFGITLPKSV